MDLFGRKKIAALDEELKQIKQSLTYTEKAQTTAFSNLINWNVATYSSWNAKREVETYATNDDVYSVISLLAETAATIPFYGYSIVDEKAFKMFKKEAVRSIQRKYYQNKSLRDLPDGDRLVKLLTNPNGSRYEFFVGLYTLLYIHGEVFIWKERIKFGVNKGVVKLHLLFPTDMIVFVNSTFPQSVNGYRYITPYGQNIDFTPDEIIHIKYYNPRNLYQQQFRGFSPLTAYSKRLSRMQGSMDVSTSQMQNGGVPGIVYDEIGAGTKEAQEVGTLRKTAFAAYLNNTANKGAPYFSSGKMGYLPLGLKLVDLDLVALSKEDFDKLLNGYHVSNVLLNSNLASTDSNVENQTTRMYTNSILPNVERVQDGFISGLVPDFGGNITIQYDISGVTELQEDMEKQAAALTAMWWITPNEKRKIQRFDDSDEPMMDEIITTNNQMLLTDLGMQPEPENPQEDGTDN